MVRGTGFAGRGWCEACGAKSFRYSVFGMRFHLTPEGSHIRSPG